MSHEEFSFETKDKLKLFAQAWLSKKASGKLICLVHGIGEHSGRYQNLAAFLNTKGISLAVFDQRGHGKSDGKRGHTQGMDFWIDDINRFFRLIQKKYPNNIIYLYGHSLGGNELLNFYEKYQPKVKGLIVTSPLLGLKFKPPLWKIILAKLINRIWPGITLSSGLKVQYLSHNSRVVEEYKRDPLVHNKISARTFIDMMRGADLALSNAKKITIPILIMHGKKDYITSYENSEILSNKIGKQSTLKLWDEGFHELHNEIFKEEVYKYLVGWVESH